MDIVDRLRSWPSDPDGRDMLDVGAVASLMVAGAIAIERLRIDLADAERRAREWRDIVAINVEKTNNQSQF